MLGVGSALLDGDETSTTYAFAAAGLRTQLRRHHIVHWRLHICNPNIYTDSVYMHIASPNDRSELFCFDALHVQHSGFPVECVGENVR